jgi:multimeric flavodoxin WrbA
MRTLILNGTLKKSPAPSNTEALVKVLTEEFVKAKVETELIRAVDHNIQPGVESDMGDGDEWPAIREKILDADILIIATPTWLGQHSSVAQRVLERMDAMISEPDKTGCPSPITRSAVSWRRGMRTAPFTSSPMCPRLDRCRLHNSRAGLDLLERGTGTGTKLHRNRQGP